MPGNSANVGGVGKRVIPPRDKLKPLLSHKVQLSHAASYNMARARTVSQQIDFKHDVSDIYTDDLDQELLLDGVVYVELEKAGGQAASQIKLKQTVAVAGGRLESGSGLGLPQVTYLSNTPKGAPLYVPQAGEAELAQADSPFTTRVMGLANEGADAGDTGFFVNAGWLTQSDWTAVTGTVQLIPNAYYYLSDTVAGKLTTVAPTSEGSFVTTVGLALDAETMFVSISQPIEL